MKELHIAIAQTPGGWGWRLMGGNNKIVAYSERYANRSNCRKVATRMARLLNLTLITNKEDKDERGKSQMVCG